MSQIAVKVENLSYRYPRTQKEALKNLNLEINAGEFIALMGENGAGKTTFCQCLNGIIPHSKLGYMAGRILINGIDTRFTTVARLAEQVGIVLEDPETQIFTTKVRNEVAFALENLQVPREEIEKRVQWALEVVGLENFAYRDPNALSGGQKQRLMIAATLAMRPKILVLDEPTSQLDPLATKDILQIIGQLRKEYDLTIIMATHHAEDIAELADRVCVLNNGHLAAMDTPEKIFTNTELMKDNWLKPPQVVELNNYLAAKGDPLASVPINTEQAQHAVLQWVKERGF